VLWLLLTYAIFASFTIEREMGRALAIGLLDVVLALFLYAPWRPGPSSPSACGGNDPAHPAALHRPLVPLLGDAQR
jgi:hypothetical protein